MNDKRRVNTLFFVSIQRGFSQMNIFIIGGMSAIFFGLIATLILLRKKDNSDIMSRRITVIII